MTKRSTAEPRSKDDRASLHQLKITLLGSAPPIWRKVQVPSTVSLADLHDIIQKAMGWDDSHLHSFRLGSRRRSAHIGYGDAAAGGDEDEEDLILGEICRRAKMKIFYEYDFGDCWEHEIVVEKIMKAEEDEHYPRCIGGDRACPPEDCGGAWGYANMLEALADPDHIDHEDKVNWIGADWDAETFDLPRINQSLARYGRYLDARRKGK